MRDHDATNPVYADEEALNARLREFWQQRDGKLLKDAQDALAGEIARATVEALKSIVERLKRVDLRAGKSAPSTTAGRDAYGRTLTDDAASRRRVATPTPARAARHRAVPLAGTGGRHGTDPNRQADGQESAPRQWPTASAPPNSTGSSRTPSLNTQRTMTTRH